MSNQPENETLQTLTSEEVRQALLSEIEASKQALSELSDEELEQIAGGMSKPPVGYPLANGVVGPNGTLIPHSAITFVPRPQLNQEGSSRPPVGYPLANGVVGPNGTLIPHSAITFVPRPQVQRPTFMS